MKDYKYEPKDVEQTFKKRQCKFCNNSYRESMIFKVSKEFICTKCLIKKTEEERYG